MRRIEAARTLREPRLRCRGVILSSKHPNGRADVIAAERFGAVAGEYARDALLEIADPLPDWIAPLDLPARRTAATAWLP